MAISDSLSLLGWRGAGSCACLEGIRLEACLALYTDYILETSCHSVVVMLKNREPDCWLVWLLIQETIHESQLFTNPPGCQGCESMYNSLDGGCLFDTHIAKKDIRRWLSI
jgi:hypothetical protein